MDGMSLETNVPNCVGLIMDGNRRWAKAKGMSSLKGHSAGGKTLKKIVSSARDLGIKHIIFYTFSTENWKRTEEEVSYLINLISEFLRNELEHFNREGGVLHYVGDLSRFSENLQKQFKDSAKKTSKNKGPHVYFALNYGGRQEILCAVKNILKDGLKEGDITERQFGKYLQTCDMPDPDIIIRTSGEMRLSGFLPWQSVYSELFFTKTLWPDFSKEEFAEIIKEYGSREIRIGK